MKTLKLKDCNSRTFVKVLFCTVLDAVLLKNCVNKLKLISLVTSEQTCTQSVYRKCGLTCLENI